MIVGNVVINTNIIPARKVQLVPKPSNLSEKPNVSKNSTTIGQVNTKLQSSSTNSTRLVSGKGATSVLGTRITVNPTKSTTAMDVNPREMNIQLPTLTSETNPKVIAN